ncbi:apolipoprotein N-acyltransferase [Acidisphaera sp. L21]|uniref:apolipoprotein N-acyltransferase n=1 Tax=Acidisphaera sp. L21 TaxID=1641851 RepID=UPI00131DC76A|nr:apolipoprotein N-acyltransferase [Acidisphaera sp. L21]
MRRWPTQFSSYLASLAGWRADIAAAILGALSAAALPPVYAIPVLLISLPGLLALVDSAKTWVGALRRGFFFGLCHHILGLYWITEAILIESARYWWLVPLAVPALSALMALFIAVPCAGARLAIPGWHRVMLFAGLWTLADLARQFIGTGFPWNPWGSVWAIPGFMGDVMIQPAAWLGAPGLTLVTVLLAATPALGARWLAGGGVALVAWIAFGIHRLDQPIPTAPGVSVVLVQGNVPQTDKWDRTIAATVFNRYLALTAEGVAAAKRQAPNQAIAVVWPETASPYLLGQDAGARAAIWQAATPATAVLAGSIRFDAAGEPFNTLFALNGPDSIAGTYDKWHLVPFGEFPPSWVPFSVQIVPGHLAFGSGPKTIDVPGLPPFGGLICYEAIYPAQLVDEDHRPDWLVNITNDAWFGNSTGPRQHLMAARMRAVEEGLPLVRAANTGITAAFDASGRELGRLQPRVAGQMVINLPGQRGRTPFSRLGLGIPLLLALGACSSGLGFVKKRDRNRFFGMKI